MSKRLAMLEQMTNSGKADAFTWYALALEYKSGDRISDAMRAFESLRDFDPTYIPMYLMAGSILIDAGRDDEARSWLEDGVQRAKAAGNDHAHDEMALLLDTIS